MSYGRSNYSECGYDRDYSRYSRDYSGHYSTSYEGEYREPKYGRSYSKTSCYEPQCGCCQPGYPKPQPIYPPKPQPFPTPWPTPWPPIVCPTEPSGGMASAFASALTAVPTVAGTVLAAATPLTVSFNAPNTYSGITVNGAVVTFTNPGTYYVEFSVPVTTTAATTLTIDAVTTPATATASPSIYTLALPSGLTNEVISYKGFIAVPAGGTVSFTITSSVAGTTVLQGQLTTFRVA